MKNMLFFGGIIAVLYLIHKTANQEKTVTVVEVDKDKYGMPLANVEDLTTRTELLLQNQTFNQTV